MQDEIKSSFWIIAEAVKEFYNNHDVLPVPGGLPDMKAESDVYIKLQNLYKEKARQDAQEVLATVRSIPGGEEVDTAEVELFCTNARFIKLVNPAEGRTVDLSQAVGKCVDTISFLPLLLLWLPRKCIRTRPSLPPLPCMLPLCYFFLLPWEPSKGTDEG